MSPPVVRVRHTDPVDPAQLNVSCQHPGAPCGRPAAYEIRALGTTPDLRARVFCTEHVHGDLARIRRTAEDDRTLDYEVVALTDGLPDVPFWPSDRRAVLKIALIALAIAVFIAGFAVLAPIMINT
jgi:hypothetical protein